MKGVKFYVKVRGIDKLCRVLDVSYFRDSEVPDFMRDLGSYPFFQHACALLVVHPDTLQLQLVEIANCTYFEV